MSEWAFIGINPKTGVVVAAAAIGVGDALQDHWDEIVRDGIIPALVPLEQAKGAFFEQATAAMLTSHIPGLARDMEMNND